MGSSAPLYNMETNYVIVMQNRDLNNSSSGISLASKYYGEFHQQLMRFLRRGIANDADVQDLSQEVYLRLLRVKTPELVNEPRAYVYRVAMHVLDEWRGRQRREQLHSSDALESLAGSETGEPAEQQQMLATVQEAIKQLPPAYSAAVILKWHYGMRYQDIAQHLGISERRVKRYIVKGYAQLRLELQTRGPDNNEQ